MTIDFDYIVSTFNLKIRGVIHIGAHYGQEYKFYKKHNIKNIMFFEPLIKNFNVLKYNVGEECLLYNFALGNRETEIDMYVESVNYGMSCSVLEPKLHLTEYPHIIFDQKETVKMKILDNIEFDKTNYNFINIDVQGYELEVFKGSSKCLHNIDYIITELNVDELYHGCAKVEDLIAFLSSYGFKLIYKYIGPNRWGEGLFVKY